MAERSEDQALTFQSRLIGVSVGCVGRIPNPLRWGSNPHTPADFSLVSSAHYDRVSCGQHGGFQTHPSGIDTPHPCHFG